MHFTDRIADFRIILGQLPQTAAQVFHDHLDLFGVFRKEVTELLCADLEDLALIMDKMGVALRSGQMCAEPLMDRLGVTGLLRASFAPYNTLEEAEYFIECLNKAINMLVCR
jgi:selenocysteine lyase/cysteine desulfurase